MFQLTKLFWKICCFQAGPQDVPNRYFLLGLVSSVFLISELLVSSLFESSETAFGRLLLTFALELGILYLSLRWFGLVRRFPASGAALLGTDAILNAMYYLLYSWAYALKAANSPWDALVVFLIVLFFFWQFAILSNIFRHAFGMPISLSIAVGFLYLLLFMEVQSALFPITST